MELLTAEERAAIDDLLECLATAMSGLDDVDPAYANKTKLQKLLYLAIDEFDLPVTYSWYLAGAIIPDAAVTPGTLRSTLDDLPGPESPTMPAVEMDSSDDHNGEAVEDDTTDPEAIGNELAETTDAVAPEDLVGASDVQPGDTTDSKTDDGVVDPILFSTAVTEPTPFDHSTGLGDHREELIDFYESVLPGVWKQTTMRFLQNFYLEHAPEPYRDLYVQSTHLRTRLRDIELIVEAHIEGTQPATEIAELVREAELDISDLHCSIRSSETLSPTFTAVRRGTDLIEDGLLMLAQRPPDDLGDEQLSAVQSLQEFFYYYVWRYPCLLISRETATGPSATSLRERRRRRLDTFEDELEREAERFERELAQAGLLPDYTDYPSERDEVGESIDSLANHYLRDD